MEGVPTQFRAWISGKAKSPAETYRKTKGPGDVATGFGRLPGCRAIERVAVLRLPCGGARHGIMF
jgi:hypothetical protein